MSYLNFDKTRLANLEYSLNREVLRTNRGGSFCSTTIIGCNTRKYHGLLICPIPKFDNHRYVFLSSLDENVIQHDAEFNLGIHQYDGDVYFPKGHKYVVDFEADSLVKTTYRVGGVILTKESLMSDHEEQIMIRYTLVQAQSATKLRFKPFLAFRSMHTLSKANMVADTQVRPVANGVVSAMYDSLPSLYMQMSKKCDFVQVPDWYYNIKYAKEEERGYECCEDLFVPGYFEVDIKKGESIIFSASLKEEKPAYFKRKFTAAQERRLPRESFYHCLTNAANQFVLFDSNRQMKIVAGYPWYGTRGRDTFIALPGLTLATGDVDTCQAVLDTVVSHMTDGVFPKVGSREKVYDTADTPLWFIYAVQEYARYVQDDKAVWKKYGPYVKQVLESYRSGRLPNHIRMDDNGLIYAAEDGKALTWMDAVVDGEPVTQRAGYPVELSALWYNAVCFALEMARKNGDRKFVSVWRTLPETIKGSFLARFYDEDRDGLADVAGADWQDWSVRPNQIIATALEYSPLTPEMMKNVLDVADRELLTPRGLRSLSPNDPRYSALCEGDQVAREHVHYQGAVWPWLIGFFATGWLRIHKRSGIAKIRRLVLGFEEEMTQHGISTISEVYNGDPPYVGKGAISQAWSVAALLTAIRQVAQYENPEDVF
ncbi:MAG: glycogen debranching enzyme family protein [Bacteroidales bacterium]|nr:glycogen debranching enzyme family protein [Bacteroidales bacterium]